MKWQCFNCQIRCAGLFCKDCTRAIIVSVIATLIVKWLIS